MQNGFQAAVNIVGPPLGLWLGGQHRCQLSAAGGDVDASPLAHRAGQSVGEQDVLEGPRRGPARGLTRVALGGVERNEVHL